MFYSQIVFKPAHRRTFQLLNDVYKQHKFIMSGFKEYDQDKLGRVLYRVETTEDGSLIGLVQSMVSPKYESELVNSGAIEAIKVKEVLFGGKAEPVFNDGVSYRFRLRANTVVTRAGKRIGLIREEALREWFEKRAENIGVRFHDYDVVDEGYMRGNKDGKELMFKIARYDGMLHVSNGKKFTKTFIEGFGHAKSFGCGLFSLARA